MDRHVLGIDCGGTFVKAGVVSEKGEIVKKTSFKTRLDAGIEVFLDDFQRIIDEHKKEIQAVGIGFAAPLDPEKGTLGEPPNFPSQWHNFPLVDALVERCKIPVCLENDANLAALGEYWMGAGKDTDVLVTITLGTGVGGGIILNGEIWNGASGIAGEVGHIPVSDRGPRCGCGNVGCLEVFASSTAVVRMAKELQEMPGKNTKFSSLAELSAVEIYKLGKDGDPDAREIFTQVGRYLGKGIAILCHVIGPRKVVLTGGGVGAWDLFEKSMKETIEQSCFKKEWQVLEVLPTTLERQSGILGASCLAFRKLEKK